MRKLFLILFFLFLGTSVYAENNIITAAADFWPPFVDPADSKEGLSLEVLRAAYKTQGYEVQMSFVPWARAEDGVKNGTYDILPDTWMTEKRISYLFYSDHYAENRVKFIKKAGDSFEYTGYESLKGKNIGIVRGYGYGDGFMKSMDFKREDTGHFMLNIKKLIAGRIDLTLEDEIVAKFKINKKDPSLLDKISFTKNNLSKNYLYVTSGIKNSRHKEIIDAFNKGLKEIQKSGEYSRIMKKYGIN